MDINKKQNQQKQNNHKNKIWIPVLIVMMTIIIVWAIWFFPKSQRNENGEYNSFKNQINKALGIFKKKEASQNQNTQDKEIDELRQKVFGDQYTK